MTSIMCCLYNLDSIQVSKEANKFKNIDPILEKNENIRSFRGKKNKKE